MGRRLGLPALMLLLAAPVGAEPIKYALSNASFAQGGGASGYLLLDQPSDPSATPTVTDWAIVVTGPNVAPFTYDPTTSTVSIQFDPLAGVANPNLITFTGPAAPACGGQRRLTFDLLGIGASSGETCRGPFSGGSFDRVPGPVITVKANGQHPASRGITAGSVRFSIDVSPAGWTTPLDWYWAIVVSQNVFWVTAAGLSTTPAPLFTAAPVPVNNATLFFEIVGGITVTTWVFAADGPNLISFDRMTATIPTSP